MRYDDIIDLPHHVSPTRPRMSMHDRAAQFSPFAALTGYDEAIAEEARSTEQRTEQTEYAREELMRALAQSEGRMAGITWFEPDARKSGGRFRHTVARVLRADFVRGMLFLEDGRTLAFDTLERLEIAETVEDQAAQGAFVSVFRGDA